VDVTKDKAQLTLVEGDGITIEVCGKDVTLSEAQRTSEVML
jgi:hypothetical protein